MNTKQMIMVLAITCTAFAAQAAERSNEAALPNNAGYGATHEQAELERKWVIEVEAHKAVDTQQKYNFHIYRNQIPMIEFAKTDDVSGVMYCLEKGDHVNGQNNRNDTALHWACYKGSVNSVVVLLKNKADVSIRNQAHQTPLLECRAITTKDFTAIIPELIIHGANINDQNNFGDTMLVKASRDYNHYHSLYSSSIIHSIHTLLAHGADIEIRNNQRESVYDISRVNRNDNPLIPIFDAHRRKLKQLRQATQGVTQQTLTDITGNNFAPISIIFAYLPPADPLAGIEPLTDE